MGVFTKQKIKKNTLVWSFPIESSGLWFNKSQKGELIHLLRTLSEDDYHHFMIHAYNVWKDIRLSRDKSDFINSDEHRYNLWAKNGDNAVAKRTINAGEELIENYGNAFSVSLMDKLLSSL